MDLSERTKEQLIQMIEDVRVLHRPVRPADWDSPHHAKDRALDPGAMVCESCAADCHDGEGLGCAQPWCSPWPCDTVRIMEGLPLTNIWEGSRYDGRAD